MRLPAAALVALAALPLACGEPTEGITAAPTAGLSSTSTGSTSDDTSGATDTDTDPSGTSTTGDPITSTATDSDGTTTTTTTGVETVGTTVETDPTLDPTEDPTDGTTTGLPPLCGNGVVEQGEACDDGNMNNDDACSNKCTAATCADGLQNQGEEKADCGGPCTPCCALNAECGDGNYCFAGICKATSCVGVLALNPDAQDGDYSIDPDGPGGADPVNVTCDMAKGGWTCVFADDFQGQVAGWTDTKTYGCAGATILGRFGKGPVGRAVGTLGVAHTQLRLEASFYALDSWDGEKAYARVDGTEVWTKNCNHSNAAACNQGDNLCANFWKDGLVEISAATAHNGPSALIEFGTGLDQGIEDESFGVDDVRVCVK